MTSLLVVPLQLLSISCEVAFILENKLRIQKEVFNVPEQKCDIIMEDIVTKLLTKTSPEEVFLARRAFKLDELRRFFKILRHESVAFEAGTYEKVFIVACMTFKSQLVRQSSNEDLVAVLDRKMLLLQNLFSSPLIKEEIGRKREAVRFFYESLNPAELYRVRATLLNSLRNVCVPVSVLIDEGIQLESGQVIPHKIGLRTSAIGTFRVFDERNCPSSETKFSVAGLASCDLRAPEPVIGENLFNADRVAATRAHVENKTLVEEDYFQTGIDIGDDLLFASSAASSGGSSFRSQFSF